MYYFAPQFMNKGKSIFSVANKMAAVGMIITLLWLTVSTPFVFAAQQQAIQTELADGDASLPPAEEDSTNPYGNNTEEKAPSGTSFSEEFLHDHHLHQILSGEVLKHAGCGNDGLYVAYHGELLVPPPNAA